MTRTDTEQLLSRIINRSKAEETFAVLRGTNATTLRFADSLLLPPLQLSDRIVQISIRRGKKYASTTLTAFDDASVDRCFSRLEDMLPQFTETDTIIPFPETRLVLEAPLFHQRNEDIAPEWRNAAAEKMLDTFRTAALSVSGSLVTSDSVLAVATSNGLFLHQPSSLIHGDVRAYSGDGLQTSSARVYRHRLDTFDAAAFATHVRDRCLLWKHPADIKAERITTIFSPHALADLLMPLLQQFSMRAVQDDKSFLRRLDGSTFVGSRMFAKGVHLRSDPFDQEVPSLPFTMEGNEVKAVTWVRDGVIENVAEGRYDTAGSVRDVRPLPTNLIMEGGDAQIGDLIKKTKRGLLVHGFASLGMVDPRNCLLSGSTRDGVFLIENGKISKAVKNLVLRETPVYLLKEVLDMSVPEVVSPSGSYFPMRLPSLLVKDVMYTQASGVI
ncbi:MAG: metallopeptidase TldD-related protein [Bacteroidia bacterium]|nr:metallopeptidase TldD-related protein [Bacteroidia bacterium]